MAAISTYLARIKSAILGEEVRSSIHDAIKAINDENTTVLQSCGKFAAEAEVAKNNVYHYYELANNAANDACEAEDNAYTYKGEAALSAQAAQKAANEIDKKVDIVTTMKSSLINSYRITDDLLDSSGNPILDSSGLNLTGSVILAEMSYVASLEKRVKALEVVIKSITSK